MDKLLNKKMIDFSLMNQKGEIKTLEDYSSKYTVIYFYPKDSTPGCTTQTCSMNDNLELLNEYGANVVGVSADDTASHEKFAAKHDLKFDILSDTSKEFLTSIGVLGERSMFGNKFLGIIRSMLIIDPNGIVVAVYPKISPKDTLPKAIKFLKENVK